MDTIVSIHTALPEVAAGAEPPTWLHLVPAGTVSCVDGRGPYVLQDMQAVITASMAGGKIPVDENHAIDFAMRTGQPSPACGWIVEMQARADGIWGRVEWKPSGVKLMSEHAYRGFSPALAIRTGTNIIAGVVRGSLTNMPNLVGLTQIHTQQDETMDLKALRTALGLPETADEAAVLARITANATAVTTHATQIADIARAAGVTASDAGGLVTVLASQQAAAGEVPKLAATVIALQTQVDTLKTERNRIAAVTAIDGAIAAGKPIAALRDHYISRHMADAASVTAELNAIPSLHSGGIGGEQLIALQAAGSDADGDPLLTADEKMTCQKMGVDPKAFAKTKAKTKGGK